MGVNTDKVRGLMAEKRVTQLDVVAGMKEQGVPVSRAALSAKMRGASEFRVGEFLALMHVLGVVDVAPYLVE